MFMFGKGKRGAVEPRPSFSRGGLCGGHIDGVFGAGLLRSAGQGLPARVLPTLPDVVPVKAKLAKLGAYALGGWFGKGNPDPFANDFGKLVLGGHPAFESSRLRLKSCSAKFT